MCHLLPVSARGVVVFRATWPVCAVSLFLKGSCLVVSVSSGQNFGPTLKIVKDDCLVLIRSRMAAEACVD